VRGDPLIQGLGPHPEAAATSSRGGDLIQGRRPHPGVGTSSRGWDLIQGLGPHPGVGTSSRGWDPSSRGGAGLQLNPQLMGYSSINLNVCLRNG
jgi:hypothetical protein